MLAKVLKLSTIVVGANFLSLLIPIYIAYKYKISKNTDDFFLSYAIVLFVSTIFSGSVKTVVIPFLKERLSNRDQFNTFFSTVFFYSSRVLIIICLVLLTVALSAYGITHKQLYLFLALCVPIVYFAVTNALFYGVLNSLDQFYITELSPFSRAIIIFATLYFFSDTLGISAVIIGYNLGELGKFAHLYFITTKKNNVKISSALKNFSEVKTFYKQGLYQIFSISLSASSALVDKTVASFLIVGSISILDYGDKVISILIVLLQSFLTLITSQWAKNHIDGKFSPANLNKVLLVMVLPLTVLVLGMFVIRFPLVGFLYPKIKGDQRDLIAFIILMNTIGFVFNSLMQTVDRALIIVRFTDIIMKTAIIRFLTNITFDIIFAIFWGLKGIAIATILQLVVGLVLNYFQFNRIFKLRLAVKPTV